MQRGPIVSQTQADETTRVDAILTRYPRHDPGDLVNILHDLQAEFRYLTERALRADGVAPWTPAHAGVRRRHLLPRLPPRAARRARLHGVHGHRLPRARRGAPARADRARPRGRGRRDGRPALTLRAGQLRRRLRARPAGPRRRRVPRRHDAGDDLSRLVTKRPRRRGSQGAPRLRGPDSARPPARGARRRPPRPQGPRRVRRHRLPGHGAHGAVRGVPRRGRGAGMPRRSSSAPPAATASARTARSSSCIPRASSTTA